MYCVVKCIVRGNQARVKSAHLCHPSCKVVMHRRKCASPVHNVLIYNCLMLMQNKTTCIQSLKYILKLIAIQVLHALLSVPCTLLSIYSMLQILHLQLLNVFTTHISNCPLCVLIYSAFFRWSPRKLCLLFNSLEQHFRG
jgi:hypothetical protein